MTLEMNILVQSVYLYIHIFPNIWRISCAGCSYIWSCCCPPSRASTMVKYLRKINIYLFNETITNFSKIPNLTEKYKKLCLTKDIALQVFDRINKSLNTN